jgi:hypothetical protein
MIAQAMLEDTEGNGSGERLMLNRQGMGLHARGE